MIVWGGHWGRETGAVSCGDCSAEFRSTTARHRQRHDLAPSNIPANRTPIQHMHVSHN